MTEQVTFRGPPWPKQRLTLEEQKAILGIHWRGHPNYQPTPAHLYAGGSYILDKHREKRILEKYGFSVPEIRIGRKECRLPPQVYAPPEASPAAGGEKTAVVHS